MLKNLSDNLNVLMARNRLNSNELARQIGIPSTTIKRIRNNEQANPTVTTLLPIAKYFSISLSQLIGDEPIRIDDKNLERSHKIPVLSWNECLNYSSINYDSISKKIFTERVTSAKAFCLIIEEELDVFPKGSILLIEPDKNPVTGDYVVIGNTKQNNVAIRKYLIEIDKIYLKPLVAGIEVAVLTSDYKVLGVIIQYKVNLKL